MAYGKERQSGRVVLLAVILVFGTGSRALARESATILSADAGPDQTIEAGRNVTLDGSGSRGPGPLEFRWKPVTGPGIVESVTRFECPVDWADSYGTRVRGWIHPPVTGSYTFWIASDDTGELWLSPGRDPAGRIRVARVREWTMPGEWEKYPEQRSAPVMLKADRAYYIEALQKEGRGGDSLAVAWEYLGHPRAVITGEYLSDIKSGPAGRTGSVTREVWPGVEGGAVADLLASPRFTGKPVAMTGSDGPRMSFTASRAGSYEFELAVSSGAITASDRAVVRVIADNRPSLVVVDANQVRGPVNPRCLGIDLNYLMDDESKRVNPVRTLAGALKEMGIRVVRYPGGDKSDSHLWSVPPYDRARPTMAVSGGWDWPAMDQKLMMPDRKTWRTKPLDFDEFMRLARTTGVESSIVVAVDAGFRKPKEHHETIPMDSLVRNAVEWVRYAKRNRFPVRCYEIGNESYFEAGPREYAETVARFAKAMKKADPGARIGAVGLYGEDVWRGGSEKDDKTPWNKAVLETAAEYLDYLIVHDYPNYGWKSYAGYLDRDPDFTSGIRRTREAIDKWAPAPAAARGRIRIALTEYGAIDYEKDSWANVTDLGHSLLLINMIGQYLAEPALDYALMWNTRWVSNYEKPISVHDALAPDNGLTPTGMALAIWARFLGVEMLKTAGNGQLKVFATGTPATGAVNVLIMNKGFSSHALTVELRNYGRLRGDRWEYSGKGPDDPDPVLRRVSAVEPAEGMTFLTLPPVSLTILALRAGDEAKTAE
jgi:hypothetical protein